MNSVPSNPGSGLDYRDHLSSSLHQLITDNEAHIPCSYHENPLSGKDAPEVDHRLRGTCPHYAGECPTRKAERVLRPSRCQYDPSCRNRQGAAA